MNVLGRKVATQNQFTWGRREADGEGNNHDRARLWSQTTREEPPLNSHGSLQWPYNLQPTKIPMFQMRKLMHKEIKRFALGHTDCW